MPIVKCDINNDRLAHMIHKKSKERALFLTFLTYMYEYHMFINRFLLRKFLSRKYPPLCGTSPKWDTSGIAERYDVSHIPRFSSSDKMTTLMSISRQDVDTMLGVYTYLGT